MLRPDYMVSDSEVGLLHLPLPARRMAQLALLFCLVAALALATTGCATEGSRIVFTSDREGNLEIYSISSSGEDEVNLTTSKWDEFAPLFSQNRKLVAFLAGDSDKTTLEVMRLDGSERTQVADGEMLLTDQRWSPDNERLAFLGVQGGRKQVMVGYANGSGSALLTSIEGDEVGDWSRNGENVAFALRDPDGQGIYIRNPDGVNELRLSDELDYSPRWSPSSKQIAFLSMRDGNPELYIMDADGSNVMRLTDTEEAEYDIAWSPRGRRILYVSEQDGNPEIYSVSSDGSDMSRLTYNTVVDNQPAWSPSGQRVAFVSYLDGDADIFVMDADGSNQKRLTQNDSDDTDPSW